ncbi:hypothetical protein ACWX0P_27520 [Vibrio mediterranei]
MTTAWLYTLMKHFVTAWPIAFFYRFMLGV